MKSVSVEITELEAMAIGIALARYESDLRERAHELSVHNESGINSKPIEKYRNDAELCNRLWGKFYAVSYDYIWREDEE